MKDKALRGRAARYLRNSPKSSNLLLCRSSDLAKENKFLLLAIFVFLLLLGAGCGRAPLLPSDGGVFKSTDHALTWQQKIDLLSAGQSKNIGGVSVLNLVFDPQDSRTIYLNARGGGLFVSYNGANSWQEIDTLPKGNLNVIAPDPKEKNIIYLGIGGKIFKTTTCCRDWQNIYLEALASTEITALAIDPVDHNKILAGLSDGRLIKSIDAGVNWATFYNFKAKIRQILINPNNTNTIYVNTLGQGVWRSADAGNNWQSLDGALKNYQGGREASLILFDLTKNDSLIMATNYGLLRSDDAGQDWSAYKLLSPAGRVKITAFGFNPQNPNEIYYTSESALYRSFDGGNRWQTKPLPSKKIPVVLLVDPMTPAVIYLGLANSGK